MEVRAKLKFLRISTRKVRLVAGLVRGKTTIEALNQLAFANKRSALPIAKLLKSAIANAVNNFSLDENNLFIKEISVDGGPALKRWLPRAHGRATPLRKVSSHVNIILGEIKDSGVKEGKKQKIEAPVKLGESPKEEVAKKGNKIEKEDDKKVETEEQGKKIGDPRLEGSAGHKKIEGGNKKGFTKKVFQRKSG